MKKLMSWLLALCILMAFVPQTALAIGATPTEAEMYTEYLLDGGYKELMEYTVKKKDLQVESCLIDLDDDGVREVLLQLTDLSTMGPRGYQCHCAVLDIENNAVMTRLKTYYGGGTLGGDMLYLNHDQQQDEYVIVLDSSIRDAIYAGSWLQQVFSENYEVELEFRSSYYETESGYYDDKIAQVRNETSLYEIDDNYFRYYQIDDQYVSKTSFDAMNERFASLDEESEYTMFEGTYDQPIKIKTVPDGYEFDEDSYSFENYNVSTISKKYFTTMFEDATGKLLYKEYKKLGDGGVCFGMSYTTAAIYNNFPRIEGFMIEKLLGDDVVYDTIRELEKNSYFYTAANNKVKLQDYIKYAHIYQLSSAVAESSGETWGDVDGLVELVQDYLNADRVGVTIGMTHFELDSNGDVVLDSEGNAKTSGHRVLAIGIEGNDILIDDPNNSSDFERLTINDDGSWSYSGAWTSDGVNSDNSLIRYQSDVLQPYLTVASGITFTSDSVEDSDNAEYYVEGMERVDADRVLLAVDSEEFSFENAVLPVYIDAGEKLSANSNLYWVKNGHSITVNDLSGTDNLVMLAGDDNLLTVSACTGSDVAMTVSDSYVGLLLESVEGESCSISFENTADDGEDLILTVTGTVSNGTVTVAQTESGISYSGLTDSEVTLTKTESEISEAPSEDTSEGSVLVDYSRDGVTFELHLGYTDMPTNPFVDVISGRFYYEPVQWAVDNEITTGMDKIHFAPDEKCNRAQVVTFLWRAAGSPEPTSTVNPFEDVIEGKFYYKAVLWAVENGITNGMDETHFGTSSECTRGQVATFLWRALNTPSASSETNPFSDVQQGRFYYEAVLWAVDAGVTTGMGDSKFAPDDTCTRGQIVTFLYRALSE